MPKKGFAPIIILPIVVLLIASVGVGYILGNKNTSSLVSTEPQNLIDTYERAKDKLTDIKETVTQNNVTPPDHTKLPIGDKKYSSSPKVGYVYSCQTTFNGGGASILGPWANQAAGTWDLTKKISVDGSVSWNAATFKLSSDGTTRTITGNQLPIYHSTGKFPIATSDDAYQYDRNPHTISTQEITLSLPANPNLLATPECIGGEVGIMLSGIPIYNAFDAGGRDAVAWEVQDSCEGHPQQFGGYHYHGPSSCLKDESAGEEHSKLVGYSFDGFGIFGIKGEEGIELSTQNLDVCHGHTHEIEWDGETADMYHYHLTHDFPYSVSCFRGKAAAKQASQSGADQEGGMQQGGQRPMPTGGMMKPPPPQY